MYMDFVVSCITQNSADIIVFHYLGFSYENLDTPTLLIKLKGILLP